MFAFLPNHINKLGAIYSLIFITLMLCTIGTAKAEFTLNWMPVTDSQRYQDPEWLNFNCNRGRNPGSGFEDCNDNDDFRENNGRDATPFLMERVRGDDGEQYYHQIIGAGVPDMADPNKDEFFQEFYIKITRYFDNDGRITTRQQEVDDLGPISDSLGDYSDITEAPDNAYDPLRHASFSGSGTGNPLSTIFRQVTKGGGMVQDIVKDQFDKKHMLAQYVDDGALDADFILDMSFIDFQDMNTPGTMVNNMVISEGGFVESFDMSTYSESANPQVTGGKYRYDSHGYYTGEGDGYDIWEVDWKQYYRPEQNVGNLYSCYSDCFEPRSSPTP